MKQGDARALSPTAQAHLRRRAVETVETGRKQREVAEVLGVTPQAVSRWVSAYRREGERVFEAGRRGRPKGSGRRLKSWQMAQLARTLREKSPEQLKLPFYLWTRDAVVELIERRYGVRVSRWTAGRYLKKWGFTPQKPVRRAFEQDEAAVRRWLNEEYPEIRRRAKAERARIYWGDEMGLRSDHAAGRSFSPKGKTPVIRGTGKRFGCNMISAITNRGHLSFKVFDRYFTGAVFIDFLSRLVRQNKGRKIFLIVDGHPAHRGRKVQDWFEKRAEEIELFFLPGYSPELNPDEMLNQDVKSNAIGRQRPRSAEDLKGSVRSYLHRRQRQPHIVRCYFHESHVLYAAA